MTSKEIKAKAELVKGKSPREVAQELDIHYTTVVKYKKQLIKDAENAKTNKVANIDPVALQVVVDNIDKASAKGEIDISEQTQTIVNGASGLAKLETKFQSTVTKILSKTEELLDGDLKPNDLKTLAGSVGDLYNNIYANNGTQVQINNNNVSGDSLSRFKESAR